MKTKLMFLRACTLLLLCCCESFFESNKEKLDKLVAVHWEKWKAEGKDTTMCIVDFAEMIPLEWDTMVYVWYFRSNDEKGLYEYMNDKYWVENEKCRGNHEEKIHCLGDAGSNAELGVHERMSIDSGRGRTSCGTDYRNQ